MAQSDIPDSVSIIMQSVDLLSLPTALDESFSYITRLFLFVLIFYYFFLGRGWDKWVKNPQLKICEIITMKRLLVKIIFVFYFQSVPSISLFVLPQFCLGHHHFVMHFAGKVVLDQSCDGSVIFASFLVVFLLITYIRHSFLVLFYFG